jgi:ABC-2 type transport system permease protein
MATTITTLDPALDTASAPAAAPPFVQVAPAAVVWSLARRELVRFFRQRHRVFGALGQPIIFWLLFSEGLKGSDLGYAHFFPGTLVMILLFTAIFATISIIEDRREGFLQSVLVAPVPRWSMVLGKVLGGSLIALLQGLVFLALGWIWPSFDIAAGPLEIVGAVVLMFVIALALTALGFTLAWRMDSTQGFHAIMSVFLLPMWLLSGAFFPHGEEGVLGWIVAINPLTYGVAGLRRLLEFDGTAAAATGGAATGELPSAVLCWSVSVLFALLMLVLAWQVAKARTTGDLL